MRRRSSSITSGRHGRRNSMVKSVALNVPILDNDSKLAEIIDAVSTSHDRSFETNRNKFDLNTYPFNGEEREFVWSRFLSQFDIDSSISFEDDEALHDLIANDDIYRYKTQLHHVLEQHQTFLNDTTKIQKILSELVTKNEQVSAQTLEFQDKSSRLIEQIENYSHLSSDLNENLAIFLQLDDTVNYLNSSHLNIFDQSFQDNLKKLDRCLAFVFAPKTQNFKEIEIYQIKFKQCMVRSLTLVRNQVVNAFKEISNELHSSHLSSVTLDALIYNKFENDCSKYKHLLNEMYIRAETDGEYMGLLKDCYGTYFKIRKPFLSNMIHSHISNYDGSNKSLVQYVQDQVQFFTNLASEEFKLFKAIFYNDIPEATVTNEANYHRIHDWLKELLNPFYQLCKNKILRETSIDRLCELIILLQKYYEYEEDQTLNRLNEVSFDKLFEPILDDVQQKLVIRINVYIDRNIINFRPTGNELTIGYRKKKRPVASAEEDRSFNDTSSMISSSMQSMIDDGDDDDEAMDNYYPPILKSLKLLNKIYLLVNNHVFSNLANSIIHLLILSIKENFEKNNIKNYSNLNDLKLYLIKNFIFLTKSIENNFDIEYVGNETNLDFSGLQSLIFSVISKKESTMNTRQQTSFFQKIIDSVPRYVNNVIDGKYELQLELRNIIHLYIDECSSSILAPVLEITDATAKEEVVSKMDAFKNSLNQDLSRYQSQIELFINDDLEIVYSLVNGIKENIILKYDEFYDALGDAFDKEALMDSDTLFFYLNK